MSCVRDVFFRPYDPLRIHWLPRVLLVIWMVFIAAGILWNVREPGPQKAPGSFDAAGYAKLIDQPPRNVPGYPFLALDAVRDSLEPVFHMRKRNFLAATVFFVLLLMGGMYAAGSMVGGEGAGLAAAVLIVSSPFIITATRTYDTHIPRLASSAMVLAFLLYFYRKPKWKASIWLVGSLIVATLICSSFSDYLFFGITVSGFLLAVFFRGLADRRQRRLHLWTSVALAVCIVPSARAIMVALPFPIWVQGTSKLMSLAPNLLDQMNSIRANPEIALAYPVVLLFATLGPWLSAVMGAGLVLSIIKKGATRYLLIAGCLIPLLILTLEPKRNYYYVANLLPALTLLSARGLEWLIRRVGCAGLVIAVVAGGFWNQGLVSHRIRIFEIPSAWRQYFVPGNTLYRPDYQHLGFEPFGTMAGYEDGLAENLANLMCKLPRPSALGLIMKPCIQERTILELAWRGIFGRDVLCSMPPDNDLPPYDAVVVFPEILRVEGVAEAGSLNEIHLALHRAVDAESDVSRHLFPEVDEKIPPWKEFILEGRKIQPVLHSSAQEMKRLSSLYTRRIALKDYMIFFRDDDRFPEYLSRCLYQFK